MWVGVERGGYKGSKGDNKGSELGTIIGKWIEEELEKIESYAKGKTCSLKMICWIRFWE